MNWVWSSPTKSSCRSTNKPVSPLRVAILDAAQPDPQFLAALHAALHASGAAKKVSVSLTAAFSSLTGRAGSHDVTLLMGLAHGQASLHAPHAAIRQALMQSGSDYQVLYGTSEEKLDLALKIIDHRLQPADASLAVGDESPRPWQWACDKCSDPACEYQLLTGLPIQKAAALIER